MTSQSGEPKAVPERSADFNHLRLDGVRHYRQTLSQEESRVSYWRRILQARLDTLRAERMTGDLDHLRPMLTDSRVAGGRTALIEIMPFDDIPPLPNLEQLWDRTVEPGDEAGRAALVSELTEAEAQLSAYRSALHQRISAATTELIARYREEPALCLGVLPTSHSPARSTA
ncbi:MAG TPA: hypothetical protein VNB94_03850 [Mycobacteriales bacterium]|nr:hypothetical protein [Mycobacteriales bacterium]